MNIMSKHNMVTKEILEIARRIKELREICDLDKSELADKLGISLEQYNDYEGGMDDIPIGVIYKIAKVMNVDSTVLLTGDDARMEDYTVVRGGKGVSIERYPGYSFSSLAMNYIGRQMNPMIVTIKAEDEKADLVVHGGQEFNYVIDGSIYVTIDNKVIELNKGDSIYFNPAHPHGQQAKSDVAVFLTVINE